MTRIILGITLLVLLLSGCTRKEDVEGLSFYVIPSSESNVEDSAPNSRLWREQPRAHGDLALDPDLEYLIGVERKPTAQDDLVSEYSFTDQRGFSLVVDQLKKTFSMDKPYIHVHGVFFPSTQVTAVWDGAIRWIWSDAVRIEALPQSRDTQYGSYPAQNEEVIKPLLPPLLKGTELELQILISDRKVKAVRKIFVVQGKSFKDLTLGMSTFNVKKADQFPDLFASQASTAAASPDISIRLARGAEATVDLSFENSEPIFASMFGCSVRHNAPPFFKVAPKLHGWDGSKVKASARITADADAALGDHYIKLVRKCTGGANDIFKIQTIQATV